jgi:hypothetical protein
MLTGISTWDELSALVTRLIEENKQLIADNEQLRHDKQELTNKVVNLELQIKQAEKRKERTYKVLISEMERE